jgi:small GTP-binding protein
MSKMHSREDEEERMAADAEKRKRMLAANHQALSSSSSEPFKKFKLLLLGDSAVGKSSLILRWTLDQFSPNLTSTVGVNFKSRKVQCFGEWIQVQVWDTSGQENFHKITTSYYRGAQGIMLVYDVTEKKSLENVSYWIKNIKAHASASVQIVLVGNKIDLRGCSEIDQSTLLSKEDGHGIAEKFQIPCFETSAKESSNVDDAFMTLVSLISQASSPAKLADQRLSLTGRSPVQASQTSGNPQPTSPPPNSTDNTKQKDKLRLFGSLRRKSNNDNSGKSATSPPTTATSQSENNGVSTSGEDREKCTIS